MALVLSWQFLPSGSDLASTLLVLNCCSRGFLCPRILYYEIKSSIEFLILIFVVTMTPAGAGRVRSLEISIQLLDNLGPLPTHLGSFSKTSLYYI